MTKGGVCLSTQQHGVDEHKLQAAHAAQGHRLGVVKGREEPPLGQLGVGHLCRRVSIVVMVPGYGIPPVLQGGCREHVLQLEGTCVQGRRRIGEDDGASVTMNSYLQFLGSPYRILVNTVLL